jgi:hypothetical protein
MSAHQLPELVSIRAHFFIHRITSIVREEEPASDSIPPLLSHPLAGAESQLGRETLNIACAGEV